MYFSILFALTPIIHGNSSFAVANEEDYAEELEAVKLGDSGVDVNVVWYDKNRIKYRMEPVDDFDGSDLRSFIHQAQDGESRDNKFIKSKVMLGAYT